MGCVLCCQCSVRPAGRSMASVLRWQTCSLCVWRPTCCCPAHSPWSLLTPLLRGKGEPESVCGTVDLLDCCRFQTNFYNGRCTVPKFNTMHITYLVKTCIHIYIPSSNGDKQKKTPISLDVLPMSPIFEIIGRENFVLI